MAKPISTSSLHVPHVPPIPCNKIPDSRQFIDSIQKVFNHKSVYDMTAAQQQSYFALLVWGLRDINQSRMFCANPQAYLSARKLNSSPKH